MAQKLVNVGVVANDGNGDYIRDSFIKVNENFTELYAAIDALNQTGTTPIPPAADLNAPEYVAPGAYSQATDAGAAGGQNYPAPQAGLLRVAATEDRAQVYHDYTTATTRYWRIRDAGVWSTWSRAASVAEVQTAQAAAEAAQDTADAAIPASEKGIAEGVATLGADGKVDPDQLPNAIDAIPLSEKGAPGGVATLDGDGLVPEDQLPPIPSGPAVGTPDWWPLRESIPAGQIPQDGQEVSRDTYPDLTEAVLTGVLPVVAEADWQSNPLLRGGYTLGDGATTIRVPDLNGKSAGSLGAVVRRGDGALSAGTNGLIQRDALQNITGSTAAFFRAGAAGSSGALGGNVYSSTPPQPGSVGSVPGDSATITFDASRIVRTATETRGLNVTGVWTVHAFGAVVNPGSVDAAQLASDLAGVDATVQTLDGTVQTLDSQVAQVFGVGQSWATFDIGPGTGQRQALVTYTNSTSRPIIVQLQFNTSAANGFSLMAVDGVTAAFATFATAGNNLGLMVVVPAGSTYRAQVNLANSYIWREYR